MRLAHGKRPWCSLFGANRRYFRTARVRDGAADADLSVVVGADNWPGLVADRLFAQSFIPACLPALAELHPVTQLADMQGQSLIIDEGRNDDWDQWAAVAGIGKLKPGQTIRFDNMTTVTRAAEKGIGIALVPRALSQRKFAAKRLVQLFDCVLLSNESFFLLHRPEDSERSDIRQLRQ